jgi:hypothetical protein
MSNDLVVYNAFYAMLRNLEELDHIEFDIISGNRARYKNMLFEFDAVVGYARDLRLIEYRVEDEYGYRAHKTIFIYRYGTHPEGTAGIERRGPNDSSGGWERSFRNMSPTVYKALTTGNWGGSDNPGRSGRDLPPRDSETKLLGSPSERLNRNPFEPGV